MLSMTKVKKAVTIDAEVAREARELSDGNLSAMVERALRREIQHVKLGKFLDDYEREFGPFDPDVLAQVDRELDALDRS